MRKRTGPVSTFSEADLSRYMSIKIKQRNILGWRMAIGGVLRSVKGKLIHTPNSLKGFPDWAGLYKAPGLIGKLWAAELKAPKGHVSIDQLVWHTALQKAGATVVVLRSFEEIDSFLLSVAEGL